MCETQRNAVPALINCTVTENHMLAPTIGKLTLEAFSIAQTARPGQFVHLRLPTLGEHMLRRPLCVYRCCIQRGEIELVYQTIGIGTRHMVGLKPGAVLDAIGPVGNGWTLDCAFNEVLLVAGGIGAASLLMLAAHAADYANVRMIMGAQNADFLVLRDDFETILGTDRLHICTDDGSAGFCGFTTDVARNLITDAGFNYLAACGPHVMQRAVARLAHDAGIPCEVSLEERMACGVGACLSCVVDTTFGKKRVCVDGPVFNAFEVIWDETSDMG